LNLRALKTRNESFSANDIYIARKALVGFCFNETYFIFVFVDSLESQPIDVLDKRIDHM